jgi:hypothetical protein
MEQRSSIQPDTGAAGDAGAHRARTPTAERAAAELRAALLVARRFPRDEARALAKIMRACERPAMAQEAVYAVRRMGRLILSPSLRLARLIAQAWGNLQLGTREVARERDRAHMEAFCWDLESNVREVRLFSVSHPVRGKINLSREVFAEGQASAAAAVRRERACILALIPQDVVEAALKRCEESLAKLEADKPLEERLQSILSIFKIDYGVEAEDLSAMIGRPLAEIDDATLVRLGAVLKALRDGYARPQDFFAVAGSAKRGAKKSRTTASRSAPGKSASRVARICRRSAQASAAASGAEPSSRRLDDVPGASDTAAPRPPAGADITGTERV